MSGPARSLRLVWSLRGKLFLAFLVLSLVTVAATGFIGSRLLEQAAVSQARARLLATARRLAVDLGDPAYGIAQGSAITGAERSAVKALPTVRTAIANHWIVLVAQADGTLVYAPSGLGTVPPAAVRELVSEVLQSGSVRQTVLTRRLPGPEVLEGAPIRGGGGRVAGAVVVGRSLVAVRASEQFPQALVWRAALIAIPLSVLLSLLLASSLSRPVLAIAGASERLSRGDFSQRVRVSGSDEIAVLARAFNSMSERLEILLRSRRDLLVAVSHELRTPLTSIQGFVQALSDGLIPAKEQARTYAIIQDEVERLRRLIEDLFLLSKLETGQTSLRPQRVSALELLQAAVDRGRVLGGSSGPTWTVECGDDAGELVADPDRIFQVLSNLLQNALRFVPPDGWITLRARGTPDRVRFEVSDSGPGIAPQDLPHIFDRFYTADPSRSRPSAGTGLGLAIARQIVRAHGGEIGVESTTGAGSLFWFELPRGKASS